MCFQPSNLSLKYKNHFHYLRGTSPQSSTL
jgi:hypothetical protein